MKSAYWPIVVILVGLSLVVWGALQPARAQNDRLSLFAGTNTTSTTAEALADSQAVFEVVVQNDPDSTTDVLVGTAQAQVIQLVPNQSVTVPVNNLALVYIKAVSGTPTVNYLARGQ